MCHFFPPDPSFRPRNTIQEKRRMRNARKKRKWHLLSMKSKDLVKQIKTANGDRKEVEKKMYKYRSMAKTFWERWRFELDERRKMLSLERDEHQLKCPDKSDVQPIVIDRSFLHDPPLKLTDGVPRLYIGRGSFGVVKVQVYRDIIVAVKEFLPLTCIKDIQKEASILQKLCHPYLPLFLGTCTIKKPYILVMQYHGVNGKNVTVNDELMDRKLIISDFCLAWMVLCAQIVEALVYLHENVALIHNDLKGNNILFTRAFGKLSAPTTANLDIQIVIIDFGKATHEDNGKQCHVSYYGIREYRVRFPHIAPEIAINCQ